METPRMPTNTPLDKILGGGIETGAVTNIYGPPGSGKTNIALCTLLGCKKVIYLDTEGSLSTERLAQLGGTEENLKNIVLIEPRTWADQHQQVKRLEKLVERNRIELIIIDSLVALYRLEISDENFQQVNRQLASQYAILSNIARNYKIPVLVTNQVYSMPVSKEAQSNAEIKELAPPDAEPTSRQIARYWSKCMVELKRGSRPSLRQAILRKHRSMAEGKSVEFEITQKGLKEVRFGIF